MMSQEGVPAGLAHLARRLAPGVVEEAVAEARERARLQLVDRLAEEIVAAVLLGLADWPEPGDRERGRAEPGEREVDRRDPGRSGARHHVPADAGPEGDHGLYVYGVVGAEVDASGLRGIDGQAEVRLLPDDSVALAVSDIDLGLLPGLDSEVEEQDLSESKRLVRLARHHDRVLRELLERGDGVLPLRFGTVLPSAADARQVLADACDQLHRELDGVRGRHEWGLRVDLVEPAGAAAREPATMGNSGGPGGPGAQRVPLSSAPASASGTAYLTRRRDQLRADADRRDRSAEVAARADAELAARADDTAPSPGGPAGRIFDCAYLVPAEEEDFLDAAARAAEELERAGCVATLTGPWPPYSFVHLTLGSEVGDD